MRRPVTVGCATATFAARLAILPTASSVHGSRPPRLPVRWLRSWGRRAQLAAASRPTMAARGVILTFLVRTSWRRRSGQPARAVQGRPSQARRRLSSSPGRGPVPWRPERRWRRLHQAERVPELHGRRPAHQACTCARRLPAVYSKDRADSEELISSPRTVTNVILQAVRATS
jgi:hypothetical protein